MITCKQTIEIKNKMINEKNILIVELEMEIERLRSELGNIANATRNSFRDDREFRIWAQNRARRALGQKPGTLTVKKEKA